MDENAELQAKIAALAGRINRHKAGATQNAQPSAWPAHQAYGTPSVKNWSPQAEVLQGQAHNGYNTWAPQRGTPYGVPRGRGRGYVTAAPVHRNRTLVLNNSGPGNNAAGETTGATSDTSATVDESSASGWVSKRDRHMQLINTSVYEQKTQQRTQAMEETRQQKLRAREEREKTKLRSHLNSLASVPQRNTTEPVAHQIFINDIKFIITDGGSKLVKVAGTC